MLDVMADVTRTLGGAVLMDGNRLRDEIVAQLRVEVEAAGSPPVSRRRTRCCVASHDVQRSSPAGSQSSGS